ncbi:UDP-N-acetylmuramoyl-tripeptide--D-alanyl-D-alanine ligase [Mechercharimyces sp. CAU 1602]|uniref:UDP-N-acetylmuramoyl-tripeptide--D-alanyl-D- alanine ligase n=1 Tax=Mechercharimyces sp. CAU 1602 TaxID=2973933 RepID=UPI00216148F5|nr:UDP-N-acetylmuramoyl-tripeptide--D-alanyl-D-alanine ligase [Mechercharimyces sp. CAU 1602]MCS1350621.1 UDP-N-acetylmuramoyl-tripeptide--D-alanyl-D-alanine ligase [Mechercharimyces sp. CAU 1602]
MKRTCEWIVKKTAGRLYGKVSDRQRWVAGVSTDTRALKTNQLYIPLVGTRFDGHDYVQDAIAKGAACALWQNDLPLPIESEIPLIVVEDTLEALQQLARAYRQECEATVVAITGSNGKTTTKDLTAAVLSSSYRVHKTEGNYNNHIGLPLTLLKMEEDTEVAVVEMGMNHAGEIEQLSYIAQPDIAVITNIGEAHIEYLGSREAIAAAKLEILAGLKKQGLIIINGDEPLLTTPLREVEWEVIKIGKFMSTDDGPEQCEMDRTGISFRSRQSRHQFDLPLLGEHNAMNALMGIAVGRALNITEEKMAMGLKEVRISGMRLETRRAQNGMLIINDTYNASPSAMRACIDLLMDYDVKMEKWLLLGDILELGDEEAYYHREVGQYAAQKGVTRLYTVGERARWIAQGAKDAGGVEHIYHFDERTEAVKSLNREGHDNVVILAKASRAARLETVVNQLCEGETSH